MAVIKEHSNEAWPFRSSISLAIINTFKNNLVKYIKKWTSMANLLLTIIQYYS